MKFLMALFALYFIILTPPLNAQRTFERWFGGTSEEIAYSSVQLNDSGYVILGYTNSYGAGGYDFYLVRTDPEGDTIWTKTYGGLRDDFGVFIAQTSDNKYIITGFTFSYGAGECDVYLIKADTNGDTIWTRTYGTSSEDYGLKVVQTSDGGYIVAGYTGIFSNFLYDIYLIKTDSLGHQVWCKTYGDSLAEYGCSVVQTIDGGYIIVGSTYSFGAGEGDVYLIKTNGSGDTIWTRTYGGALYDYGSSVDQTTDSGYIIAGGTESYGAGGRDFYLIKTDQNGDTVWTRTYGGLYWDVCFSAAQTTDGGYIVTGYTNSYGAGNSDVYLIKTNQTGNPIWTKTYGGVNNDVGCSVVQTSDGGYVIGGYTDSYGAGGNDLFLIKTDQDGNINGIDEDETNQIFTARNARLYTYPNPFRVHTNIRIELPCEYQKRPVLIPGHGADFVQNDKEQKTRSMELKIFDISGRLVKSFSYGHSSNPSGISWDGCDINGQQVRTGIYFVRLEYGGQKVIGKIVKMK